MAAAYQRLFAARVTDLRVARLCVRFFGLCPHCWKGSLLAQDCFLFQEDTMRDVTCLAALIFTAMTLSIDTHAQLATNSTGRPSITVQVGSQDILLGAPDGFVEASGIFPEGREARETTTPPTNRLLAWFLESEEVSRRSKNRPAKPYRALQVQVMKQLIDVNADASDFAEIKASVFGQQALVESMAAKGTEELNRQMSEKGFPSAKIATPVVLGVFHHDENSITIGMAIPPIKQGDGDENELTKLVLVSTVLVREKILYLYTNTPCRSFDDIAWANDFSQKWIQALIKANR